jgi:hypothetical protein
MREEIAEAAEKGVTPLQYALAVLGDEEQPQARRDAMCALAMPFVHPRLAAVMTQHTNAEPIKEITWRILPPQPSSLIEHEASEPASETEHWRAKGAGHHPISGRHGSAVGPQTRRLRETSTFLRLTEQDPLIEN